MIRNGASRGSSHGSRVFHAMVVAVLLAGCGTSLAESGARPAPSESISEFSLQTPCEVDVRVSSDGPDFTDVEGLRRASDVVIMGTVADQRCVSGSALGESSMVYLASEVLVRDVLSGEGARASQTVSVVQLPGTQEASTPLVPGEQVVLFLARETPGEQQLQDELGEHWTPVGWDSGIADVDGATLRFRGGALRGESVSLAEVTRAGTG